MPDNTYRGLHCIKIDCLTRLNKSFKEQSDDRIKLTIFLNLGKVPLSNIDTECTLDGEGRLSEKWWKFPFYKLHEKDVAKQYHYCGWWANGMSHNT